MADDEALRLRDLPPVEPVAVWDPGRMSQTLAAKLDACPRAGYLYLKWNGGPGSHAMDRGTVVHVAAERMMLELIKTGERSMLDRALHQTTGGAVVAEDLSIAEGELAQTTKGLVDEILAERPDLCPTSLEVDAARAMAWHVALGLDVDPGTVLGVERKFVLELPSGMVVSGKVDLLSTPEVGWVQVDDYKTSFNVPPEEEFDEQHSFQVKLYAAAAMFGFPVERRSCDACKGTGRAAMFGDVYRDGHLVGAGVEADVGDCQACRGRGSVEVRLQNVGEGVNYVRGRQLYPRARLLEMPDGTKRMVSRERVFTRTELADFLLDLERIADRLRHGLSTWKFPAVPGRHCSECPAPAECPLPAHLRRFAGLVNSPAQASEALAWWMTQRDRVKATEAELKAFAKKHGPILVLGGGEAWGFTTKTSSSRAFRTRGGRSVMPEFIAAAKQAAEYGLPFNPDDFLRAPSTKNEWGPVEVPPDEVARMRREIEGGDADAGFVRIELGEQPAGDGGGEADDGVERRAGGDGHARGDGPAGWVDSGREGDGRAADDA